MQDIRYAPLITALRVYETEFLTENDFNTLLKSHSLTEALNLLDKTAYDIPSDVEQTHDFEAFLNRRLRLILDEMERTTVDHRIISLFTLRYTYHNLKVLTKQKFTETSLEDILIPIGEITIDQLKQFMETGEADNLPDTLTDSVKTVHKTLEETNQLAIIDVAYDRAYLKHIHELSKDINHSDVTTLVDMLIDFENLSTLIRAVRQNQSRAFVMSVLSEDGSVPIEALVSFWDTRDYVALMEEYKKTTYGDALDNHLDNLDHSIQNPVAVDQAIAEEISHFYRQFSLHAFGPMPILAFLHFLDNEINNIRMILISKDNDLPQELMTERMRPIYGI